MAAAQPPQDGGLPRQTVFRATDRPAVDPHAEQRWDERAPGFDQAVDVAWREAESVPFGTHNATYLRYHVESDTLLLAERTHDGRKAVTTLKTVLKREWRDDDPGVRRAVERIRRERGRS